MIHFITPFKRVERVQFLSVLYTSARAKNISVCRVFHYIVEAMSQYCIVAMALVTL
jgi:hypothetical protein